MFRILKYVHINPFYLLILFGYGFTRFAEWIANTSGTWTSIWHITSQFLDRHKPISFIFGLPVYVIIIHWTFAVFLTVYDIIEYPKFLERLRNGNRPKRKLDVTDMINQAKVVLTNQLVILPASMVLTHYLLRFSNDLHLINFSKIPSFSRMFYKFTLCLMIYEVLYFYLYWMLHHPLLHKPMTNKIQTTNSNLLPIEYILLSITTPSLAIFFTKCDIVTSLFFLTAIVVGPIFENSKVNQSTSFTHDYNFNEHYDPSDILNIIHGTCKNFLKSENFENHRVLLSMKPPKRKCEM